MSNHDVVSPDGYPNHFKAYMTGVETGVLLGGLVLIAEALAALGEAGRIGREVGMEYSAFIEQVSRLLMG